MKYVICKNGNGDIIVKEDFGTYNRITLNMVGEVQTFESVEQAADHVSREVQKDRASQIVEELLEIEV